MKKVQISHYSDVLCVWAYVSQIRMDELIENFGSSINVNYVYFSVFGNAMQKLENSWRDKGGLRAYGKQVQKIVSNFGHLEAHSDVWIKNPPHSSLPCHLYLSAAQLAEEKEAIEPGSVTKLAWNMRTSFFAEGKDISNITVIKEILEEQDISIMEIDKVISCGEAYAVVSRHMQNAVDNNVRSSPTLIFNEGRQRLTGNVGYRILEANIRELLEKSEDQQTWC